ncbi:putative ATPase [Streptomyces africanus]|uniref:ATPase n=1 Tax=Streptomyces africanus TaxID=231024 RepID=A0ABU0QEZ7_9ACTN|nr:ATP-binding protein [Streptomyces africanus]MDQ0745966.1 putative ATPase [Streptomyces africanus]
MGDQAGGEAEEGFMDAVASPSGCAELAGSHADRTWDKRMREFISPDLLILDDFAMRQLSASQADGLYELVSERQGRSLVITSNTAPSDWYPLLPDPVVAESLLDRLLNARHQVIMNGPSYRPNKEPKGPTDKPGMLERLARRSLLSQVLATLTGSRSRRIGCLKAC